MPSDGGTVGGSGVRGGGGGGMGAGGAIFNRGEAEMVNSTVSVNAALGGNGGSGQDNRGGGGGGSGIGGAVFNLGTFQARSTTFAGNTVKGGDGKDGGGSGISEGGVYSIERGDVPGAVLVLSRSILANTTGGKDCYNDRGHMAAGANLIENEANCTGVDTTKDPRLGPLRDNGGPTPTRALRADSPAIDPGLGSRCLATDQRGVERPQGSSCDIGAFEAEEDR